MARHEFRAHRAIDSSVLRSGGSSRPDASTVLLATPGGSRFMMQRRRSVEAAGSQRLALRCDVSSSGEVAQLSMGAQACHQGVLILDEELARQQSPLTASCSSP
jgi:hypothetical protein